MIGSLVRHTLAAGVMFCGASFVVLSSGLAWLWTSGRLNEEKSHQILAIVYGVDLEALEAKYAPARRPAESEQPSFDDLIAQRLEKSMDLDLRETAFDKALLELRSLEADLRSQRDRFDARLREFEVRIAELRQETLNEGLANLQLKLEAIQPKQAKDLIMKMIEEPADENDDSLDAAVTILKNMSVEKSRKIIAEFETPEEIERLHEILGRIRLGRPAADILTEAQRELEQY
jgi:hypothetical protein